MRLVCDLCGGTLEMRNGSAVCQGCGLTYSMETLREKMANPANNTYVPARAVSPVPTQSLENQYNLIRMHIKSRDLDAAQKLCDRLLAVDYNNADAWELKIRAACSGRGEVETFFQEYLRTATTPEKKDRVIAFAKKFYLDESNHCDLMKSANILLPLCPDVANKLVSRTLDSNVQFVRKRIREFENCNGPDEKKLYLQRHLGNSDETWQANFMRDLAAFSGKNGSDVAPRFHQLCEVEIEFANKVIASRCVEDYTWMYKECERLRDFYKPHLETAKRHIKALEERRKQEAARKEQERQCKIAEYWEAHPEEKQELESARTDLQKQIDKLRANFKNSEEVQFLTELEVELKTLKTQYSALGLFSFKEKKALKEQIESKEIEIMRAKKRCEELEYRKNNQVKDLKYKIQKINDRLMLIGVKPKL